MKPVTERDNNDLLQLTLEMFYRSMTYGKPYQLTAYEEALTELKRD